MSNNGLITVNRQGREAFDDNEHGYDDSYVRAQRDYKPPLLRMVDFRVYAVLAIAGLTCFVVFFIIYSLWKWLYCMRVERYYTCRSLDAAEPIGFAVVFFLPMLLVCLHLGLKYWTRTRYENALANKANLVLDRYGDQQPADLFDRLTTPQVVALLSTRYESATVMETAIARHKMYRGVNALSLSNRTDSGNTQQVLDTDAGTTLVPLEPDFWIPIANDHPHVILAGATGEGKTVTAKAILLPRLQANELLFVIDPHSSNWYGIAGRGGGEDWHDVVSAISDVFNEYKSRINARHQHLLVTEQEMPEDYFTRLNVLVDEAFLIKENLDHGSRKQVNYWTLLAEIMGSGARKIGISLILLTQTANVEDLGLSGPLRRNFFRIALDTQSIRLMIAREETDHARKVQLYESLIGTQYPATSEIGGRIELLDRSGLLPMATQHIDAKSRLWAPPSVRPVGAENGRNGAQRTDGRNMIDRLVELRSKGISREDARLQHGLIFENADWTIAGQILGED